MLVLSRKKGESIIISDTIEVVILETEGDTVKIGIQAPCDVEIHRKEIFDAILNSNREASSDRKALIQKLNNWKNS
ncbi:carbon storage regulator CsrA [Paenibacillus sp. MBLB2552]|uniref:Translational regulator CsrA n=1 Tax=Paenibacillus mellifer TaxID=2937794 RepID=A0A9X2BUG6_9BACL|nr:carbon storage regulator CsrA [Paenibacillus mellifer]MCK8489051.1 carbon storage regulator CsrA [Paenibacillus mellifer]